ncbi:MAG: hypothetical protein D6B27_03975 [Gammaproteobacteria bacterium]|nr:MAG: hypothetical protein D6B27_03975 [Gammaproteobacteria bacterium]
MYNSYFGFSEPPFSITPNPQYLYLSKRHREALAHLLYGIKESGGFVQLTGEVGTGKTMLTRALLDQIPGETDLALIFNPRLTVAGFLESICDELGIKPKSEKPEIKEYVDLLSEYLLNSYSNGRKTVLLIDEAQNLDFDVIEQVRLLTNIETAKEKLLQIILVGQPELKDLLKQKNLRQVAQRITARYHLEPLSKEETAEYIAHRMKVAGVTRPVFTSGAISAIRQYSSGIPRLINIICDRSLLGAYAKGENNISKVTVIKAVEEVNGEPVVKSRKPLLMTILFLATVLSLIFALYYRNKILNNNVDIIEEKVVNTIVPETAEEVAFALQEKIDSIPVSDIGNVKEADIVDNKKQEDSVAEVDDSLKTVSQTLKDALVVSDTSLVSAFSGLFGLWGQEYRGAAGKTGCEKASNLGLKCFFQKGSWGRLLSQNRPAIVEFQVNSDKKDYALLTGVGNGKVKLQFGNDEKVFYLEQFVTVWTGNYWTIWLPPSFEAKTISLGSRGEEVVWLRNLLVRIYPQADSTLEKQLFTEEYLHLVEKFQSEKLLQSDGVVGEQTMVYLIAAAAIDGVPLLERDY